MTTIAKVLEFHEAFGCNVSVKPELPPNVLPGVLMVGRLALEDTAQIFRQGAAEGDRRCHRLALITEELAELAEACEFSEPADALDALVDLRYVLDGTVIEFGMHRPTHPRGDGLCDSAFETAFARVHAANMAKLGPDGKPIKDATGKVCKPAGWVAPDLSDLIC